MDNLINKVHCMDAIELLKRIPDDSVNLLLTDPPYGLAGRTFEFPHKHYTAINESWDTFAPVNWMAECQRVLVPGGSVLCFGVRQSIYAFAGEGLRLGWKLVNDVTWVKPDAPPCFTGRNLTETTERFLWFCPDGKQWTYNLDAAKSIGRGVNLRDVWTFNTERDNRIHPAQKPLELIERCIMLWSKPDDVVLDCFAGSGTTALAARNQGRRWIVGDSNPDYCKLIEARLATEYTVSIFEADIKPKTMPLFEAMLNGAILPPTDKHEDS